jgi:hypothetical protein
VDERVIFKIDFNLKVQGVRYRVDSPALDIIQ